MKIVVMIIMVLVAMSFALKLTCHRLSGRIILCALAALFTGLAWPYAAIQSKTQIASWLMQPQLMLDTSVVLTIDVFLQIAFCVLAIRSWTGNRMTTIEKWVYRLLLWIPSLLIFPVLFSVLVEVVFAFPGADFAMLGWCTAAAVFAIFIIAAWLAKEALPEIDLRIELIFLVNIIIGALGIIATVNGRTAAAGTNTVEWWPLTAFMGLVAAGLTAGIIINKYQTNKKISRI